MRWLLSGLGAVSIAAAALVLWFRAGPGLRVDVQLSSSNIERGDYVGPDACAECHPDKAKSWKASLHPSMNARATPASVVAPFAGEELSYGQGRARFFRLGADYLVRLTGPSGPAREFKVTRTIGSAYIQEYVGLQVSGPEPAGAPHYQREVRLPFGYWRRKSAWFHQQYYDSWFGPEYQDGRLAVDAFTPELDSWDARCPWCHNTYAFELRQVRSDLLELGHGIEAGYKLSKRAPRSGPTELAASGLLALGDLVTVGISCESCHLGGRAHARDDEPMTFGPRHPALEARPGQAPNPGRDTKDALCAQCHSAPSLRYANGGAKRNSSEALDMAAGVCGLAPACIDCHDPHQRGQKGDLPVYKQACLGCHGELESPGAQAAHSRHEVGEADCLDCHMPRLVQGFSAVIRTHRISLAFDPAMVAAGQPNACNLCHVDRSVTWASQAIGTYWNRTVKVPELSDGPGHPAGQAWLTSDDPHLVVTAADAIARSPAAGAYLGGLIARLDQPIAYYRMRMLFAIEDIVGRELSAQEYDPSAPPLRRAKQVEALARKRQR